MFIDNNNVNDFSFKVYIDLPDFFLSSYIIATDVVYSTVDNNIIMTNALQGV